MKILATLITALLLMQSTARAEEPLGYFSGDLVIFSSF